MKVGVVGGGMLGLTLSLRLLQRGHTVELFEAAPQLGGLACAQDYGAFVWDRFYHVILAQDLKLIGLLQELGLGRDLRFTRTGTGYYTHGRLFPMSSSLDFLRFPHLSPVDKARLGLLVTYATRVADPWPLYNVSAADWLTKICGRRAYQEFWQPLLRAKFGPFHDKVAAVFIWATLTRLFGARSSVAGSETMGYVRGGGYSRVWRRFEEVLRRRGARLHMGAPVQRIEQRSTPARAGEPVGATEPARAAESQTPGCRVRYRGSDGVEAICDCDQVIFTGPTPLARRVVAPELLPVVRQAEQDYPAAAHYLGVACLVLALPRPLTPYYVTNVGDASIQLTGVIEMTTMVDRVDETAGLHLVYLPRYLDSEDPRLLAPDAELIGPLVDEGVRRIFPHFDLSEARYVGLHRARHVQALPLTRAEPVRPRPLPLLQRPLQILNTSMLSCATLNNNEVVGQVEGFVERNGGVLGVGDFG